jgi:hypothetical protein
MIVDISKVDVDDILSCWMWKIAGMDSLVLISVIGDLFLCAQDGGVYWLQTGTADLSKVADDLQQFNQYLKEEEKIDEWFLPLLIKKLIDSGKVLKEDEVYSFKIPPILGGEYSMDNIEATNMSVHFAISGQVCEQIKDLPDGTKINKVTFIR